MKTLQAYTATLKGTSYDIGYAYGKMAQQIPPLLALQTGGMEGFGPAEAAAGMKLFDQWCPGITEEIKGFADAAGARPEQIFYTAMTYLRPRCSQIGLAPGVTKEGKPLVARNYEFSHEAEDFTFIKTCVQGKYSHIGTSVLRFGREDGLNEHGLSVTMSSCGFPVGAQPYMRPPKITGLMYWAVIRALLENCRDVADALSYLEGMPIAFNLNLILMDKKGNGALYETLDGRTAQKRMGPDSQEGILWATNHAVLPELIPYEPEILIHAQRRYDYIEEKLSGKTGITKDYLKDMLLSKYPNGLCCHYYEEFFGTTKSMIISPADGTIELCWGGRQENGWQTYSLPQELGEGVQEIEINSQKGEPEIFGFQPRL